MDQQQRLRTLASVASQRPKQQTDKVIVLYFHPGMIDEITAILDTARARNIHVYTFHNELKIKDITKLLGKRIANLIWGHFEHNHLPTIRSKISMIEKQGDIIVLQPTSRQLQQKLFTDINARYLNLLNKKFA